MPGTAAGLWGPGFSRGALSVPNKIAPLPPLPRVLGPPTRPSRLPPAHGRLSSSVRTFSGHKRHSWGHRIANPHLQTGFPAGMSTASTRMPNGAGGHPAPWRDAQGHTTPRVPPARTSARCSPAKALGFGEEPRVVAAGRLLPPWKQEKPRRGDSDATLWAGAEGPPSARGPRQREAPTCEEGPHLCAHAFGFHAELDSEHFPEL